jgi:uncharacterized protein (TIGR00251 family)
MGAIASALISVRVQARSRRPGLVAQRAGVLVVRVGAPALDGRANHAVCRLLAQELGVRDSSVTVVRGERAREKLLRIDGLDQEAAEAALGLQTGQSEQGSADGCDDRETAS